MTIEDRFAAIDAARDTYYEHEAKIDTLMGELSEIIAAFPEARKDTDGR